jgi:hypothetical protein
VSRFLSDKDFALRQLDRERQEEAWDEREKKLLEAQEKDFEKRRWDESLYIPHQNAIEPALTNLWIEYVEARGLDYPAVERTPRGFTLCANPPDESFLSCFFSLEIKP